MTNWTEAEVEAVERQFREGAKLPGTPEPKRRVPKGPNKTEARYGQYLALQQRMGEVAWFAFEDITLRIGTDCRYTPDFAVIKPGEDQITFHEVKGRSKTGGAFYKDDARVKIAAAAKQYFPVFRFKMVWPGANGEWESKDF